MTIVVIGALRVNLANLILFLVSKKFSDNSWKKIFREIFLFYHEIVCVLIWIATRAPVA